MAEEVDPDAMIQRYKDRAHAVEKRDLPLIAPAEQDFLDDAIIGDATAILESGISTLTVDLRLPGAESAS